MTIFTEEIIAADHKGRGKPCIKCKGQGRIMYEVTNHGERNEFVIDNCWRCGGNGREPSK